MIEVPTVTLAQVPDPLPAGLTVLDVREPVEWQHGRIDGAVHIPMGSLPGRLDELLGGLPSDGEVLVVCKVGGRSAQVTAWLQQQGVAAVNLEGGMIEWSAAGRPMVADGDVPPLVV